jgi:hypothetical protein
MISKVFNFGSGEEAEEQGARGDEEDKKNSQCPMPHSLI